MLILERPIQLPTQGQKFATKCKNPVGFSQWNFARIHRFLPYKFVWYTEIFMRIHLDSRNLSTRIFARMDSQILAEFLTLQHPTTSTSLFSKHYLSHQPCTPISGRLFMKQFVKKSLPNMARLFSPWSGLLISSSISEPRWLVPKEQVSSSPKMLSVSWGSSSSMPLKVESNQYCYLLK